MKTFKKVYQEWQNYKAFTKMSHDKTDLIFYSESQSSWVHFKSLINALWKINRKKIVYLTSDQNENEFLGSQEGVTPIYIGDGIIRTLLFTFLKSKVMIMTMPDLQNFHIKRSIHSVNYVYIHHSIVSCHMIYNPGAFDHFDTVFCVGPHHEKELRAWETKKKLKQKKLIKHGYGRLDQLIKEKQLQNEIPPASSIRILIAPSWGKYSLLERHGWHFMKILLEKGFHITLRPHPQTRHLNPNIFEIISKKLDKYENFKFEENMTSTVSFLKADIMISDWSGAALEFAFSRLKPVVYVDLPKKINNNQYNILDIEPLEVFIREQIGVIIPEDKLDNLNTYIDIAIQKTNIYSEQILKCRTKYIYNLEKSGMVGAKEIIQLLHAAG